MLRCFQLLRSGFRASTSGQLRPQWGIQCNDFSTTTSGIEKWERRCQRLNALLRRVRFGRLESFQVDGKVYELPVRSGPPTCHPSREELEYLGGFFDGDGCVSLTKATGKIRMSVSQAVQRPGILLRFRDALGGGIYCERDECGTSRATLQWLASDDKAKRAALVLHSFTIMKQAQLHQLLEGNIRAHHRTEVAKTLLHLKAPTHEPHQGTFTCTWPFFAGLFDAEGYIGVSAMYCSIGLTLGQTNPYILKLVLAFLQNEGLDRWKLYRVSNGASKLVCRHFDCAKLSLEQLLTHGLSCKRLQAQLCLDLKRDNHSDVCEAVSQLNGQQSFYSRLDEAGIERAKAIHKLQIKLSSLRQRHSKEKDNQITVAIEAQIKELREEHQLGNLQSRYAKLRFQLRKVLSEGGVLSPARQTDVWQKFDAGRRTVRDFLPLLFVPAWNDMVASKSLSHPDQHFPTYSSPMLIQTLRHQLRSPGGASHNGTELPGSWGQTVASGGAGATSMFQCKTCMGIPW